MKILRPGGWGPSVKAATEYLWFETPRAREFVNITERVRDAVAKSGVREGLALVSAMHITAAVYVNDDERGLIGDIEEWADKLAPPGDYRHHRTGESNGDSHLKNLLLGHQVVLPITQGDLDLGPWEQVFYAEFDGRRRKRVIVKVLGE
jgi:secondary thiamine-phosphate synthase enzyme